MNFYPLIHRQILYYIVNQAQEDLNQRDVQINEYQEKLSEANLEIQQLHSNLEELQNESNNTIETLSQDLEVLTKKFHDKGLINFLSLISFCLSYLL